MSNPFDELGREPGESEFGFGKGIQESETQRGNVLGYHLETDALTMTERLRAAHAVNDIDNNLDSEADEISIMKERYERES